MKISKQHQNMVRHIWQVGIQSRDFGAFNLERILTRAIKIKTNNTCFCTIDAIYPI